MQTKRQRLQGDLVYADKKTSNGSRSLEVKEQVRALESSVVDLKRNEVENIRIPSKLTVQEEAAPETMEQESKKNEVENSKIPSKLTIKEDGAKEPARTEIENSEIKTNKQESSKDEKKSRPKLRVDSDEDEDGLEDLREKKMDSNKKASGNEKKSVKKITVNDSAAKVSEGLTCPISELRNLDKGKKKKTVKKWNTDNK
eukprot:Gb_31176 [translate_table: standard]